MEAIKKEQKYTYADYASWELEEGERYELIDGVPYMMSAPTVNHQSVQGEIFRQLANFLKGRRCQVFNAPFDVCLYGEGNKDKTVVQPDILVVCDKNKLKDGKRCNGAPTLIVEILSLSTARMDLFYKLNKYLQAGVQEYWIVNPETKEVSVHLLEGDKYITTEYSKNDTIAATALEGFSINLQDVFANLTGEEDME
jgi:Uma2 family endonuclease